MVKKNRNVKKITLSLTDETEARLREIATTEHYGIRGGLSQIVETALRMYFDSIDKANTT